MKIIDRVLGQKKAYEFLQSSLQKDRFYPVQILAGPSGVGKKLVALALTQNILCEKSSFEACGECPACRKVENLQNENVHIVSPDGQSIKVEQVKDILHTVSLSRWGKATVILFDEADKMNPQSANALLKTLEEPPPKTYFFLISSNISHILPTIRSRAQVTFFQPIPVSELKKLGDKYPTWALQSCGGRMDILENLSQPERAETRKKAIEFLLSMASGSKYEGFSRAKELQQDGALPSTIQTWQIFFRDILQLKFEGSGLFFEDQSQQYKEWLHLSENTLLDLLKKSLDIEKDVASNFDKNLLLENFWLDSARAIGNQAVL